MMFSLSFVEGSKSAENPLADLDRGVQILGGPNLGGSKSAGTPGIPGEKSGLKYPKPFQSLLSISLYAKVASLKIAQE